MTLLAKSSDKDKVSAAQLQALGVSKNMGGQKRRKREEKLLLVVTSFQALEALKERTETENAPPSPLPPSQELGALQKVSQPPSPLPPLEKPRTLKKKIEILAVVFLLGFLLFEWLVSWGLYKTLTFLCFLLLAGVLCFGTIVIAVSIFQAIWEAIASLFRPQGAGFYWRACGERRGLYFDSAPPGRTRYYKLQGNYRGCMLEMETGESEIDKASLIQIRFPQPLGEGLRIYPETDSIRQLPSHMRGDIVVGDKAFDDAFVVKGGFEESVRQRLNPRVRHHLLRLWQILEPPDQFEVFDDRITYQFPKFIENPEQVFLLIDAMVDVVDAIAENRARLFIKSVGAAERCEICHQTDEFDHDLSYCRRCEHVSA